MGQEKASVNTPMPPMVTSMLACGEVARNMARAPRLSKMALSLKGHGVMEKERNGMISIWRIKL